jgi:O-antigen/teichoic acid export membrane protein
VAAQTRERGLKGPATLARNFTSSVAGNLTYAACQWGTIVALTKLGNPDLVGQFALALALTAPAVVFSQLNLRAVQATDVRGEYAFPDYLAVRLVTTSLAIGLLGASLMWLGSRGAIISVILLVAAAKAIDSVTDVFLGEWQRAERLDAVSMVYGANGVVSLAGLVAALVVTRSLTLATVAYAGGSAFALGIAIVMHPRISGNSVPRPTATVGRLWTLVKIALPLGPVMLLVTLNGSVPRYFVAANLGNHDLGIFAALSYLVIAGTTLVGAMGQSLSPRLARHYADGDVSGFTTLLVRFALSAAALGACGVVVAIWGGSSILSRMYSAEYGAASGALVVIMVAGTLSYVSSVLGYGLTAARQFTVQVPLAVCSVAATAGAAALLVPRLGITGAAWAGALGATAQIVGSVVLLSIAARTARMTPTTVAKEMACEA